MSCMKETGEEMDVKNANKNGRMFVEEEEEEDEDVMVDDDDDDMMTSPTTITNDCLQSLIRIGLTQHDAMAATKVLVEHGHVPLKPYSLAQFHVIFQATIPGVIRRHAVWLAIQPKTVVVMCGIPGSGKTTLATHILREERRFSLISHVQFDALAYDVSEWTGQTYHLTRQRGLQAIANALDVANMILVDDNMMYKSMRKEVKRVCAAWTVKHPAHCVVMLLLYMNVDVEVALRRNAGRVASAIISPNVIRKMKDEFDVPKPSDTCLWVNDNGLHDVLTWLASCRPLDIDRIYAKPHDDPVNKTSSSSIKEQEVIARKRERGERIRNARLQGKDS